MGILDKLEEKIEKKVEERMTPIVLKLDEMLSVLRKIEKNTRRKK